MTETAEKTAVGTAWKVDPAHSSINFTVRHMLISNVHGTFRKFDITATDIESESPTIEATVDVDSIDTRATDRDNHLKSDDFFNAEKYPHIRFVGKKLKKTGNEEYELTGDLTIRDKTSEITLDVKGGTQIKDPWGSQRVAYTFSGEIDRFNFELKWNQLLETGGAIVGPKVKLHGEVQLTRTEE